MRFRKIACDIVCQRILDARQLWIINIVEDQQPSGILFCRKPSFDSINSLVNIFCLCGYPQLRRIWVLVIQTSSHMCKALLQRCFSFTVQPTNSCIFASVFFRKCDCTLGFTHSPKAVQNHDLAQGSVFSKRMLDLEKLFFSTYEFLYLRSSGEAENK